MTHPKRSISGMQIMRLQWPARHPGLPCCALNSGLPPLSLERRPVATSTTDGAGAAGAGVARPAYPRGAGPRGGNAEMLVAASKRGLDLPTT